MGLGAGFGKGLLQGQQFAQGTFEAYQQGRLSKERAEQKEALKGIADEKAAESSAFTDDVGKQLDSAVQQGFNNVTFDDGTKSYTAKNAAGESKNFAMNGVTDFMGQRLNGSLKDNQSKIDQMRTNSMADVIGKTDPMRGLQLRSQARRDQRDSVRDAREDKQWGREDDIERIDNELGQKFKTSLVGPDGQPRQATADDYLSNMQQRIFALGQAGHSKAAEKAMQEHYSMANVKLQMETKERESAVTKVVGRLDAGDPSGVIDYYNKFMPTGDKLTGIETNKDGTLLLQRQGFDGKAAEPLQVKSMDDLKRTIIGSADYKQAYQISQDMFRNNLSLKHDARADSAEARADTQLAETMRHNRAAEGIAAMKAAGGGGRGGRGAEGPGAFDPLSDFDPKQARKAAMDQAIEEAKGTPSKDGKPVSGAILAARSQEIFAGLRDAASKGNSDRQRASVFSMEASSAKTPEEIQAVRERAAQSGYSEEEMGRIDPRFAPAKRASAAIPAPSSVSAATPSPRQAAAKTSAPSDPVLDSPAGAAFDAAKAELASAKDGARKYGLRQRQADPTGYEAAMKRWREAKSASEVAERDWQSQITRSGLGAYTGGR